MWNSGDGCLHIYIVSNQRSIPMQLKLNSGPVSVRRNKHMRSLWVEYPRKDKQDNILAGLTNLQYVDMKINLPVLTADAEGIEIKLPSFLSGIFYLMIQDGDDSFLRRIALQ